MVNCSNSMLSFNNSCRFFFLFKWAENQNILLLHLQCETWSNRKICPRPRHSKWNFPLWSFLMGLGGNKSIKYFQTEFKKLHEKKLVYDEQCLRHNWQNNITSYYLLYILQMNKICNIVYWNIWLTFRKRILSMKNIKMFQGQTIAKSQLFH
jgi:hypothetical protein